MLKTGEMGSVCGRSWHVSSDCARVCVRVCVARAVLVRTDVCGVCTSKLMLSSTACPQLRLSHGEYHYLFFPSPLF